MAKKDVQKLFKASPIFGGVNTSSQEGSLTFFLGPQGEPLPCEYRDMENFIPLRRGGLRTTDGFSLYRDIGSGRVTGIYKFVKSDGTTKYLASQAADLYTFTSGSHTSIYSSLSSNAYTHFETAMDKCVICDGTNAPIKYDGSTVASLGGSPPSGARASLFYQNRLWIFSASSNPSYLYYSDASNIESGYGSNFVQCDVNDGQKITAISKFFIPGSLEPAILVTKENSVGLIQGDGSTGNPYTFVKVNQDIGNPAFRGIVQFGSDIAYFTTKGVSTLKTDVQNINLQYNSLTRKVQDQFLNLNQTKLSATIAWHDWKRYRICFAVAEASKDYPNVIWCYDTEFQGWYKERFASGQYITAAFVDSDGTVFHGDELGNIFATDNTSTFNNETISAFFTTDFLNFGTEQVNKRILQTQFRGKTNGAHSFEISHKLNNGRRLGSTHSINLTASAYTWGGGVWTSNTGTYQWGGSSWSKKRYIPSGWFENIQMTLTHSVNNKEFQINQLEFFTEFGEFR